MDKRKALIYLNQTGNEAIDQKSLDIVTKHCETHGCEPVIAFTEYTELTGMSVPVKYMSIGLMESEKIDVVVTLMSSMIGESADAVIETIGLFEEHDLYVETVAKDMDSFYEQLFETQECNSYDSDDEEDFIEFMSGLFSDNQ